MFTTDKFNKILELWRQTGLSKEELMNQTETTILNAAEALAPTAPVVQATEAVISTIANPTAATILNDIELAISLVKQLKAHLNSSHPSLANIVKLLF